MSQTSVFGDYSDNYMRYGLIPTGGMAIECGCITINADTSANVPTQFQECYAFLLGGGADATGAPAAQPCVSGGFIKCTFSDTIANGWYNYIAVGN